MLDNDTPTNNSIPEGFCQCGCGEKTTISRWSNAAYGYVKGKPRDFIKFHHHRVRRRAPDYKIDPKTGCWNWLKKTDRDGYGHTSIGNTDFRASRVYFEIHKHAIPNGMVIDHLCRNRKCVNPDHLEVVTVLENARRGDSTKLTPDDVRKIRQLIATGHYTNAEISQIVGIGATTVSLIRTGKRWADVAN